MSFIWIVWSTLYVPYVPPSSLSFQIGIWSPKQHLFWPGILHGPSPYTLQTVGQRILQNFKFLTTAQCGAKRCRFQEGVIYLLFGPHSIITCFLGHTVINPFAHCLQSVWQRPMQNSRSKRCCLGDHIPIWKQRELGGTYGTMKLAISKKFWHLYEARVWSASPHLPRIPFLSRLRHTENKSVLTPRWPISFFGSSTRYVLLTQYIY